MLMRGAAVPVRGSEFHPNQVQLTMAHTPLGDQGVREVPHRIDASLEDDGLQALVMVEMGVRRRHREIVMRVLQAGESLAELALVMVVDVGERRDAVPAGVAMQPTRLQMTAKEVPDGLAATRVAALRDQVVEGLREIAVERDGESVHG